MAAIIAEKIDITHILSATSPPSYPAKRAFYCLNIPGNPCISKLIYVSEQINREYMCIYMYKVLVSAISEVFELNDELPN